jgi:hypothetical protein
MNLTIKKLIDEVNQIPIERLEEVYQLLYSFNHTDKVKSSIRTKILSFAGILEDLNPTEYSDFLNHIQKTRETLFDRNSD